MRKSWNDYFMDLAILASERATCNRLKVGAVIVKDNKIISTGYNGSIHGHSHCIDEGCLLNDEGRCIRTIHAELNAILHADHAELIGSTLYCTHEPCETCMKHINQAGIQKVIFYQPYHNKYNQYFSQGMEVIQYVKEETERVK